jgi:ubiquinone/menaquinone biosynthesis C-methylase UbiE
VLSSAELIERAGYNDPSFPSRYDAHRPSPPAALLDLLCLAAQIERPSLVVDLGSGTGLSTRAWADRADEAVGVEASAEMRARAEEVTEAENVRFVHAFADATGLPDESADIVTCSQSFHWMDPETTLTEVARILRPGGVFAAYDYDWPPVVHWELERAFEKLQSELAARRGRVVRSKETHLSALEASGLFRYTREALVHTRDRGSAERVVGMALSLGPLKIELERGASEEELGLAQLRETARRVLGDREVSWFMCYRVRLGVT